MNKERDVVEAIDGEFVVIERGVFQRPQPMTQFERMALFGMFAVCELAMAGTLFGLWSGEKTMSVLVIAAGLLAALILRRDSGLSTWYGSAIAAGVAGGIIMVNASGLLAAIGGLMCGFAAFFMTRFERRGNKYA